MAVDALIPIVCLQEENFHFDRFLARVAESSRQPQQPAGKRDLHVTVRMDTKRARLDSQPSPPPVESKLPLHRLLASSSSSSDPTELTKIWWDKDKRSDVTTLGNAKARHAEMAARAEDLPEPQQLLLPVRAGSEPWIIPPAEFSESPTEVIERSSKSAKSRTSDGMPHRSLPPSSQDSKASEPASQRMRESRKAVRSAR
jgi:hypothetical protein